MTLVAKVGSWNLIAAVCGVPMRLISELRGVEVEQAIIIDS